jgi:hypothetical protein
VDPNNDACVHHRHHVIAIILTATAIAIATIMVLAIAAIFGVIFARRGLANVKVSTTLDPDYTPFWQSRFQFQQLDGWVLSGAYSSTVFTTCGSIRLFGGFGVFGKGSSATRLLTHLPRHTKAVISWTWAQIDSWDNEYVY